MSIIPRSWARLVGDGGTDYSIANNTEHTIVRAGTSVNQGPYDFLTGAPSGGFKINDAAVTLVRFRLAIQWASNAAAYRRYIIRRNPSGGNTTAWQHTPQTANQLYTNIFTTPPIVVSLNDEFTSTVYHIAGSAQNLENSSAGINSDFFYIEDITGFLDQTNLTEDF